MPAPAIAKAKPEPVKSAAYGHVCIDCAKAKVKCYPRPEGGCVRCHRRNQECIPATPARRLGAKKSSGTSQARSSRLEGKLDHLVDLIRSQQAAQDASASGSASQSPVQHIGTVADAPLPPPPNPSQSRQAHSYPSATYVQPQYTAQRQQHAPLSTPAATTTASSTKAAESPAGSSAYENDLTFMSPQQAEHCLHTFRSGYMKYLPYIHLPPEMSVEQLRRDRPFLWLNIQGVCTRPPSRQLAMGDFIREVLAKQYIVEGERSMDLLLGTLTYLTWAQLYNRGRPQMTMLSHIARALTYDLRINKDLADEALTGSVYAKVMEHPRPAPSHEVRRALLSCYITSSVTTSFGRIAPLPWSLSMEDAAHQLRASPDSINDEILVAIASARRIIDETSVLNKLHAEDPVGFGSFAAHIPALKAALEAERKKLSPELRENRLLASYFNHVEVCIYELVLLQPTSPSNAQATASSTTTTTAQGASALATDHSGSSVSLPTHPRQVQQQQDADPHAAPEPTATGSGTANSMLTAARSNTRRIGYLTNCLEAAKRCLDNLLSLDAEDFLYMTFSVIVQSLYSLQTLNRLALVDGVPGWERSEVREVADGLEYMGRMEAKLRQAGQFLKDECTRYRLSSAAGDRAREDHGRAAAPGRGNQSRQEDSAQEEESSFSKGAELLKKTAEAWSMVLNAKQQSSAKTGGNGLKIDFQVVNFSTIGHRTDENNNGVGNREGDANGPQSLESTRAPVSSICGVLNPPDTRSDVVMPGGVTQQQPQQQQQQPMHMSNAAAGGLPMYSNPYAVTTAGMMPAMGGFGGEMTDPVMFGGMPDYTWMSDMLGYWEL